MLADPLETKNGRSDPRVAPTSDSQIIAFGGCGTGDRWFDPRIVRYVVRSSGRPRPRVGLVTAALGDPRARPEHLIRNYERVGATIEQLPLDGHGPARRLAETHDVIHVEGGNLELLLERLHRSGMTAALRQAWHDGVLLTGTSAGAACWFEFAIGASMFHGLGGSNDSGHGFRLFEGIGLVPGLLCVHADREPQRRRAFDDALPDVARPDEASEVSGWTLDHAAGLHFRGLHLTRVVASTKRAGATRVTLTDDGTHEQHHPGTSLGPLRLVERIDRTIDSLGEILSRRIARLRSLR